MRTVDNYLEIRRDTVGARPSLAFLELKVDIPDEVMAHPSIITLAGTAVDMIIIANDIYSYNVE